MSKRPIDALIDNEDSSQTRGSSVCIAASTATAKQWPVVLSALEEKHPCGHTLIYKSADHLMDGLLPQLRKLLPQYLVIVAHPSEVGESFVRDVHTATCCIDPSHPFTDVLWGIVTGHNEDSAQKMAAEKSPLRIQHVVSGSVEGVDLDAFESGIAFDELVQGAGARKNKGEASQKVAVHKDATFQIAEAIEDSAVDMIITSGHARETEWNVGFRFPGGQIRSGADGSLCAFPVGQAIGPDAIQPTALSANVSSYTSSDPATQIAPSRKINAAGKRKVYSAAGNCLMAHINSDKCMALGWMHSAGVRQMTGYTVESWFGYAGWGVHRYLWANVGALTFAEAFFANQQALRLRLQCVERALQMRMRQAQGGEGAGQNGQGGANERVQQLDAADWELLHELKGLQHDRETTALYGDPVWEARMLPARASGDYYSIELLHIEDGSHLGAQSFEVIVTTLRPGCWTPKAADDKSTLPGRPPILLHYRGFWWPEGPNMLAVHDRVVVRGLSKRPELNGLNGRVTCLNAGVNSDRIGVQLEQEVKSIALQLGNVERVGLPRSPDYVGESRTALVTTELVATRLFVMVPLEGPFEAGQVTVRRFEAFH